MKFAHQHFVQRMNDFGSRSKPFLFIIDFAMQAPLIFPLDTLNSGEVLYEIEGVGNAVYSRPTIQTNAALDRMPPSYEAYCRVFDPVMWHLQRGDSYLLNLTQPVNIGLNMSLKEVFFRSKARFKLWFNERFVVFSPEPFVRIEQGMIHTFPMKGTMDAALPEAESLLMNDAKELAEHYTIVDLLRNDLNMVASQVRVERFRYLETIETSKGSLLQTSSHISGLLPHDYQHHLGDIIFQLLPAGSISGAPKKKTIEIIGQHEGYDRGYYTGVFGLFDGKMLNSAVMIRFIEKTDDGLIFKAGGGITVNSKAEVEYNELIQKVYLPFV